MKASAVRELKRPAIRTVIVKQDEWSSTWEGRPASDVAVGLRTISDAEESDSRRDATDSAAMSDVAETQLAEYNDALMAGVVASALCDPNDCSASPRELPEPHVNLRRVLSSGAIRRLFHEWEVMAADASPAAPHADDDEIAELIDLLLDDAQLLSDRARRLASALLDELRPED